MCSTLYLTSLASMLVELGFWIPILSGIPDFLRCIPESEAQNFGVRMPLHKTTRQQPVKFDA